MTHSPDLSSLADEYDIVGRLDAADDARTYIANRTGDGAKRRDDQTGVLITVVTTPAGDEANALSHLAADSQVLARTGHRRLLPVIEGRWLGDDAFAVITQRTTDPSLAQRLASGETFTNPRVAAILRDVNGLLEWAREQKIVHRNVPASRVFLEPKTDRVRVFFDIAPIQRLHRTDAQDDARTIARLAMAMLTGEVDPRAYDGQSLSELRPDLPERLEQATAAVLDEKNTGATPDVAAYLALIGMADPVAAGEAEREHIRTEILDEQRAEREKLAAERVTLERTMAEERAAFERTMVEERAAVEAERLALQQAAMRERDELQGAASAERTQILAAREEVERTLAEQRAALERVAARDREMLDELREKLRRAGEREIERKRQTALDDIADEEDSLDDERLAPPPFPTPVLAPLQPLDFDDGSPLMRQDEIVFGAPGARLAPADALDERVTREPGEPMNRRRWILWGSAAAVLALIGISASLIGSRLPATPLATPAVAAARTATAPAAPAAPTPLVQAPPVMDSARVETAARWLDSLRETNPLTLPRPARIVRQTPVERRPPTIEENPFFIPGSVPAPRDSVVNRDSAPPVPTTPPPA